MDETSLRIDAPPERLYDLITDVTNMGRWSPECTGGKWLKGADGPAEGAKFRGANKHGIVRWWTHCTVTKADRPTAFEWDVAESGMRWGYRFEPDGDGTIVTEYREKRQDVSVPIRVVQRSGIIGRAREDLMVEGMKATLQRLQEAAET